MFERGNDGGLACETFRAMTIPKQPKYTGQFKSWWDTNYDELAISISGAFMAYHAFGFVEGKCNIVNVIQKYTYGPCDGHANPDCV